MQFSGKNHHMIVTAYAYDEEKRDNILIRIGNKTHNFINKLNEEIEKNKGFKQFEQQNGMKINTVNSSEPTWENIQGILNNVGFVYERNQL